MKVLLDSKRRLAQVVHEVRMRIEADVAAMRGKEALLAGAEDRCLMQLSDETWANLRNAALVSRRLQGIRQKRLSLQHVLSEAVAKAFRQRLAEERLAEQIAEIEAELATAEEEETASERAGFSTVAFSLTQDP